jgi:hypothetical protein
LAPDESLEVVVDDGLSEGREVGMTPGLEEDRVSAEAFGHARDAGLRTMEGACDLAMARAGGKSGGD